MRSCFIFASLILCGCSGASSLSSDSVATYSVSVSWDPNRESAVNSSGGGYRILYSTESDFETSSATVVDIPFVSGTSSPTTATIDGLEAGTYYFRIVAYSSLNPPGSSEGAESEPSEEFEIFVP